MPIYEYVCLDCGKKFEALRLMKESDQPIECQTCKSFHVSRLLTLFNARSGGKSVAGNGGGCAGCSGGSCANCGH
jgi:putative FmdB family regulatory protein